MELWNHPNHHETPSQTDIHQVHEFLSWVCGRGASVQGVQQGDRYDVVVTNLSDRASKRFTFEPVSCDSEV